MLDVMLDLEALSQDDPNAAIVAIGAVAFDRKSQVIGGRFYVVVDLQSSLDSGGVVDGETVMWWMRQSEAARRAIAEPGISLREALSRFTRWLSERGSLDDIRIWGNGSAYDNVVLKSSYHRLGLPVPWHFRNDKCYRTLKTEAPQVRYEATGTLHHAADDAEAQVQHLFRLDDARCLDSALLLAELDDRFPELAGDDPLSGGDAVQELALWREQLHQEVGGEKGASKAV